MTPKEKAIDLLNKMNNKPISLQEWTSCSQYAREDLIRKCNIIVDEILKYQNIVLEQFPSDRYKPNYWQEVKQELENFKN